MLTRKEVIHLSIQYADSSIPIVHLEIVKDSSVRYSTVQVQTPAEMADLCKSIIGKRNTENVMICAVDTKKQPVLIQIVGTGAIDYCGFSIPDIWKAAMICNAAAIMIAHNHPSGSIEPSAEDIKVTEKLVHAGKMLEIPLLDHIIVTGEDFYSFRENRSDIWK